jgi:hypothetical protein
VFLYFNTTKFRLCIEGETKLKIRWELLRLPGVGNKIADKICRMREEGVQFTRDNLINIPYLAHSPELFEIKPESFQGLTQVVMKHRV